MSSPHDPDADARIDEMARAAGGELRRPAPADGIARAQRSKRTKQTARLALAGTAVLALGVAGVAVVGGDDSNRVGPTETVITSVPDSVSPTTTAQSAPTTTADPNPAGAPELVYGTSGSAMDIEGEQTLFDPADGSVSGSAPIDPEQSRQVQDERYGRGSLQAESIVDPARPGGLVSRLTVGGLTYVMESLPSEITSLDAQDPQVLPRFDRCGQPELVVTGASGSALPDRITSMSIGADGRYLVVLSAACPVAGTLVDGYTTQPYELTLEVFDAADPSRPGRALLTEDVATCQCDLNGFSFDGRFVALRGFAGGLQFRVFDLEIGTEVDVDQQGCEQYFTDFADIFGPWVGASSMAVLLDCDGNRQLLIRDVAPGGGELRVELTTSDLPTVEIDVAHFDSPSTAWFTVCSFEAGTCWLRHGNDPPVELPGVKTASFVPLGFRYGG